MKNVKTTNDNGSIFAQNVMTAIASSYAYAHREFDVQLTPVENPLEQAENLVKILYADNIADNMHHTYDKLNSPDGRTIHAFAEVINNHPGDRAVLLTLYTVAEGGGFAMIYTLHERNEKLITKHDVVCLCPDKTPDRIQALKEYYQVILSVEIDNYLVQYLDYVIREESDPTHPIVSEFSFNADEINMIKYTYECFPGVLSEHHPTVGIRCSVSKELRNSVPKIMINHLSEITGNSWGAVLSLIFEFCPTKLMNCMSMIDSGNITYEEIFESLHGVSTFDFIYPFDFLMSNDVPGDLIENLEMPFGLKINHGDDNRSLITIRYNFKNYRVYFGYTVSDKSPCGSIDVVEVIYCPTTVDGLLPTSGEIHKWIDENLIKSDAAIAVLTMVLAGLVLVHTNCDDLRLVECVSNEFQGIVPYGDIGNVMEVYSKFEPPSVVDEDKPWYEVIKSGKNDEETK